MIGNLFRKRDSIKNQDSKNFHLDVKLGKETGSFKEIVGVGESSATFKLSNISQEKMMKESLELKQKTI